MKRKRNISSSQPNSSVLDEANPDTTPDVINEDKETELPVTSTPKKLRSNENQQQYVLNLKLENQGRNVFIPFF